MNRILVVGGGVAGCAAAVAAARAGARVTLLEAGAHLGGVAAHGDHRTLCGLAAIDAPTPDLLEPELTAEWVAALATGAPRRLGRVWLWPTDAQALQAGLAHRLKVHGVELRLNSGMVGAESPPAASAPETPRVAAIILKDGTRLAFDALIDACGSGDVAAAIRRAFGDYRVDASVKASADAAAGGIDPSGARAPTPADAASPDPNWPAFRAVLAGQLNLGAVARLRAETAAAVAALVPAAALVALGPGQWQLSLDLAPGTALAEADAAIGRASSALGMQVLACARRLAARDEGRPPGTLTLGDLFATTTRGWCWAAWPAEHHGPAGVVWTWPPHDRYGIPLPAVHAFPATPDFWSVGKGMPVTAAAAAALRVTGTGLALGTAVGVAAATRRLAEHASPTGSR